MKKSIKRMVSDGDYQVVYKINNVGDSIYTIIEYKMNEQYNVFGKNHGFFTKNEVDSLIYDLDGAGNVLIILQ